jgi:hypothetical protein
MFLPSRPQFVAGGAAMRQRRVRLGAALAGLCAALVGPSARAAALRPDGVLANIVSPFDETRSVLREYTAGGSQLQTWNIAYPGAQSGADYPRTVTVDPGGSIQIYNGTGAAYLTTLNPVTGARVHHPGPGFSTINGFDLGGVAAVGHYAFVTDMNTFGSPSTGLVRFDTRDFSSQRFRVGSQYGRLTIGADGLLYALEGGVGSNPRIDVLEPETMSLVRSVVLPSPAIDFAVWRNGDIYAVVGYSALRYSRDGVLLASAQLATPGPGPFNAFVDVSLSATGQMVMGTDGGQVIVSDISFAAPTAFHVGNGADAVYVSSTTPVGVPEPGAIGLSAAAAALALIRRRRHARNTF